MGTKPYGKPKPKPKQGGLKKSRKKKQEPSGKLFGCLFCGPVLKQNYCICLPENRALDRMSLTQRVLIYRDNAKRNMEINPSMFPNAAADFETFSGLLNELEVGII